jgi:hypothetical protein
MKDIMIDHNTWEVAARRARTRRAPAIDNGHLRVLLLIAAMLLALALGIDQRAVDWLLGREPSRISAYEAHQLDEVRYLLTLDAERRTGPAQRR